MNCSKHEQRQVVRLWAFIDLGLTLVMALPFAAIWLLKIVYVVSDLPISAVVTMSWFMTCATGAMGVLWAAVRLFWPDIRLGIIDILGRLWIAGLLVMFLLFYGLPGALWGFVITEALGAIHQLFTLHGPIRQQLRGLRPDQLVIG